MNERFLGQGPLFAPGEGGGGGGNAAGPVSRRASSVTLRQGQQGDQDPFDPANQSLADALNVMFTLLKVGMVGLGVAFLLTGFQRVSEGEQGIRLLFGKVQDKNLEPGLRWSAPYPIGSLIKVKQQGYEGVSIDKDFWVYVPEGTVDPSVDKLAPTQSLKPDQGGSGYVITGDGNIAHTKWRVGYKRADVVLYATNVPDSDQQEAEIVRAAMKRGIVRACAQTPIEDLLKQGSATSSVALIAKQIAQETLDRMNSGLVIDQCSLDQVIAPLWVRGDFQKVAAAVSEAAKQRDKAQTDRSTRLNEAAGRSAAFLVGEISDSRRVTGLIPMYEGAIAAGDVEQQAALLSKIEKVLDGTPVEIEYETRGQDGSWVKTKETITDASSGEIAFRLQDARRYRSEVVNAARSDLLRFEAKLEQFNSNPLLMVQREWSVAYRSFLDRDSVQIMMVPEGASLVNLMLNSDPDVLKEIDQARRMRENEKIQQERMRELRQGEYKTQTDLQEVPS